MTAGILSNFIASNSNELSIAKLVLSILSYSIFATGLQTHFYMQILIGLPGLILCLLVTIRFNSDNEMLAVMSVVHFSRFLMAMFISYKYEKTVFEYFWVQVKLENKNDAFTHILN
jgi:hypothetical protein